MFVMRASDFHSILEGTADTDFNTLEVLKSVVEKYPYFQAAQVLLAKEMWQVNHISKQEQVEQAAIRVADRAAFHSFLFADSVEKMEETKAKVPSTEKKEAIEVSEAKKVEPAVEEKANQPETLAETPIGLPDELIPDLIKYNVADIENQIPTIEEKEELPADAELSFLEWLNEMGDGSNDVSPHEKPKAVKKKKNRNSTEIIDTFIANEPKISGTSKSKFYSASEMGRQSVKDDFDFVSETLADIYAQQGDREKAEKAYRSLMLKYPEKSSYFAARLKKLGITD